MSTHAQTCANRLNDFEVLDFEDQNEYDRMLSALTFEHRPETMTESILVETIAQSYWLRKRALYLQDLACSDGSLTPAEQKSASRSTSAIKRRTIAPTVSAIAAPPSFETGMLCSIIKTRRKVRLRNLDGSRYSSGAL